MKVGVVGSRSFRDKALLFNLLDEIHRKTPITQIVSGGAQGADYLGECYAKERNIPVFIFKPDWKTHGRRAGFVRNKEIVLASDQVHAFWDGVSFGTKNTIDQCENLGVPSFIHTFVPQTNPFYE